MGLRLSRWFQRFGIRRAKALISPSRAHAREISNELEGKHPIIKVIPNVFSFQKMDLCRQEIDKGEFPIVLYVGRLDRVKGVPLLLETAHFVVEKVPEVKFVLAGAGHPNLSRSEIDRLISCYHLGQNIELLGHVSHEKLDEWYRKAAVCVVPSHYESFGIAALEPMGFGLPIVSTDVGGLPEIVLDGETGVLVSPGNSRELAQALLRLLADHNLRAKLAQSGKERVQRFFDKRSLVRSNLETYYQASK
jgi:glycosyltransferase involved in cell wall biosynthesis